MHEADVVKRGRGLEAGDVAAEFGGDLVGLEHDGRGVPADGGADLGLDLAHARMLRLLGRRDGVDIGGVPGEGQLRAILARFGHDLVEQGIDPLDAFERLDGVQGLQPFPGFLRGIIAVHGFLQNADGPWRGWSRHCNAAQRGGFRFQFIGRQIASPLRDFGSLALCFMIARLIDSRQVWK